MEHPHRIRSRLSAQDVPRQLYALAGASLVARDALAGAAEEAAQRIAALPAGTTHAARQGWRAIRMLPAGALGAARDRALQLRSGAEERYRELADDGERALAQWHAERVLNRRADRLTRSVTPAAARAGVSARDAARRAAGSPRAQRVGSAGRRARASARRAWEEYLAAVEATGAQGWGDAAVNATPVRPAGAAPSQPR